MNFKISYVLCISVLVMGLQMNASEQGQPLQELVSPATEEQSSIPVAPPLEGYSTTTESVVRPRTPDKIDELLMPDALYSRPSSPLSPTSEQAVVELMAPSSGKHLPPPPRILKQEVVDKTQAYLNEVQGKISVWQDANNEYRAADSYKYKQTLRKLVKEDLSKYAESDSCAVLITQAEQLLKDLNTIQTMRGNELRDKLVKAAADCHQEELPTIDEVDDEQNKVDPADSQEKDEEVTADTASSRKYWSDGQSRRMSPLKWILGSTIAVATIATIVWYFWWKKPAVNAVIK